ncbi:MAG: serine/threonine-protein kinase [Chloroflexales bacterium]
MLAPGSVLQQRYVIEARLGQGGFGAVYRARHQDLNRLCAIKELFQFHDANYVTRFRQEAAVLAGLKHPALPQVTDYFVENERSYLVMEYIAGQNLDTYLANQPNGCLNQAAALPIVCPILEALAYLHSQRPPIIHRDIKDANICLTDEGAVYLVDFGIAKVYDPALPTSTLARAVTPGYSPYEQYGAGATDARSDIYALGATFYRMLTGEVPPEAILRVRNDPLQPPHELNATVSPAVERIVLRMLAVWPDERYPDVAAVRRDLDHSQLAVSDGATIPIPPPARRLAQPTMRLPPDPVPVAQADLTPPSVAVQPASTPTEQDVLAPMLAAPPRPAVLNLLRKPKIVAAILGVTIILMGMLFFNGGGKAARETPTPPATQGVIVAAAERTATPFATITPSVTTTPLPPLSGSITPAEVYTGTLPLTLTISGQRLERVERASLVAVGRTAIPLTILDAAPARLTLRVMELHEPLGGAVRYTLLLNDQPQAAAIVTLRDFLESRTVRGVRLEYAYTGRIDPTPQTVMRE